MLHLKKKMNFTGQQEMYVIPRFLKLAHQRGLIPAINDYVIEEYTQVLKNQTLFKINETFQYFLKNQKTFNLESFKKQIGIVDYKPVNQTSQAIPFDKQIEPLSFPQYFERVVNKQCENWTDEQYEDAFLTLNNLVKKNPSILNKVSETAKRSFAEFNCKQEKKIFKKDFWEVWGKLPQDELKQKLDSMAEQMTRAEQMASNPSIDLKQEFLRLKILFLQKRLQKFDTLDEETQARFEKKYQEIVKEIVAAESQLV